MVFFTELYAADGAAQKIANSNLASLMPLFIVCVVFYFLIIKPSQNKNKKHKEMLENISVGSKICTAGGIFGTVSSVEKEENFLFIEVSEGVRMKILKESVVTVIDELSEKEGELIKEKNSSKKKKRKKIN